MIQHSAWMSPKSSAIRLDCPTMVFCCMQSMDNMYLFQRKFVAGSEVFRGAHFGEGSGPIFLESFSCVGSEEDLLSCVQGVLGYHQCDHRQDAGVRCIGKHVLFPVSLSSAGHPPILLLADYNECLDSNGGCDHICVNSVPGHQCVCETGYVLQPDGRTCIGESLIWCISGDICSRHVGHMHGHCFSRRR